MSKIIVIKPIQSNLINISQVLRTDIEASNRGILALSSSGVLTLVVWIKKRVWVKNIEDVSDAMWQKGGVCELIAACHSGALLRCSVQQDSGLTNTLQLSAQSLLNLINLKDSGIKSLKSLRIWGHTKQYILLQAQPDRLVLMLTNSGQRPCVSGIIKTPNIQSAHLAGMTIIVQPCTGSDIYIHDAATCKAISIVTLAVNKPGATYIQWDCLACSFSASRIAVTDSERRLYIACFDEKKFNAKKSGIKTFHLVPHQVVWPAAFEPSSLHHFVLSLSDDLLSVFCSTVEDEKEEFYYFTYNASGGGSLSFQYKFTNQVSLLPGLSHEHPDLFLTEEGLCMLTDKECRIESAPITENFESLLGSLEEALKVVDMDKISQIKNLVEEDLGIFLSSCNHMEDWVEKVEKRSQQHAQLVDMLLSHLTKLASEQTCPSHRLSLKELAKHHFKTLQMEMSNVLKYVDGEKVAQQLLIMVEQMNFYLKSVEAMKLPEGSDDDQELLEKFETWGDRPVSEILTDALQSHCVKLAENYFGMKPWIYGQIETSYIVSCCIEIARQYTPSNLLLNMEESYVNELRANLFASKELKEITLLEEVLDSLGCLKSKESLALYLLKYTHQLSPHIISKPPSFWTDLIDYENIQIGPEVRELTIGLVLRWTMKSINLILIDLYARVGDEDILNHVQMDFLWTYLLVRKDQTQLLRWIGHQISGLEEIHQLLSQLKLISASSSPEAAPSSVKGKVSSYLRNREKKMVHHHRFGHDSLLSGNMYCSDTESVLSIESSILEGVDENLKDISESSSDSHSLTNYIIRDWPEECFVFIQQEMLDDILLTSYELKELLLNILAQYGLFLSSEKEDPSKIIQRLIMSEFDLQFKPCKNDGYTHRVDKSNLDKLILESFLEDDLKLPFYEYALVNGVNLNAIDFKEATIKPWIKLLSPFWAIQKKEAKDTIYHLCLETLSYFICTKKDLNMDYLSIFLTMLYAPHATLKDFLTSDSAQPHKMSDLVAKDVMALTNILAPQKLTPLSIMQKLASGELPHIRPLIQKPVCLDKIDISMYDLLRGTIPFDLTRLFTWQNYNKYAHCHDDDTQPSFSNQDLCLKEGIKCSLDYYYYLKAGRPTYALASILLTLCSPDDSDQLQSKELSVYGLALVSWPDKRICSSCIALLFIADLNYETLRTILFTADLIVDILEHQDARTKMHENLRKSKLNLLTQDIKSLLFRLMSVSTRSDAGKKLVSLLEKSIINRVSHEPLTMSECLPGDPGKKDGPEGHFGGIDFLSKDNLYYILIGLKLSRELSAIYHLSPPSKILEFLAFNNQWLLFLVSAHIYRFPSEVVHKTCSKFSSQSLKEHIEFCLDLGRRVVLVEDRFTSRGRTIVEDEDEYEPRSEDDYDQMTMIKLKESAPSISYNYDGKNLVVKNRRRVKRKKQKSITSVESKGSVAPCIGSYYTNDAAIGTIEPLTCPKRDSKLLPSHRKPSYKSFAPSKWEAFDKRLDVFSVVLKCHKQEKPAVELLEAAITLASPIMAVIAACYDPQLRLGCLVAWLYAYIPEKIREEIKAPQSNFIKILPPMNVEDLLNQDYLEQLIAFYLRREHVDILIEAFSIFEKKHIVLPLIQALECSKLGKDEIEISKFLNSAFGDSFENGNLECFTILGSVEDVTRLCITTVCHGIDLYLKNRFLQLLFLKALLPFCDSFPFENEAVNWNQLYKILKILGSIEIHVQILENFLNGKRIASSVQELVSFLIGIEEYDKAFNMASLLNLDTADIYCHQFKSDFETMKKHTPVTVESMRSFLAQVYSKMTEKNIPLEKAVLLFETVSNEVTSPILSFLSLQYAAILAHRSIMGDKPSYIHKDEGEESRSPEKSYFSPKEDDRIKKAEHLEMKMWCFFIEAQIVTDSKEISFDFDLPTCLGLWPWEIGPIAKDLKFDTIEQASEVGLKFEEEHIYAKDHFDRLFLEKESKCEDILLRNITSLIQKVLEKELVVTACRIQRLLAVEIQDIVIMKKLLKRACSPVQSRIAPSPVPSEGTPIGQGLASGHFVKKPPRAQGSGLNRAFTGSLRYSPEGARREGREKPAWLAHIYNLSADLSSSYGFAHRIVSLCRIANELALSYLDVIQHGEPSTLVTEVLSCDSPDRFQLAKELIEVFPVPIVDVNSLLFVEVLSVIRAGHGASQSTDSQQSLLFNWNSMDQRWPELLALTDSPSAIGIQLVDAYLTFTKETHPDHLVKAQTMSVEALIRAHDCFSESANIEGINNVLQAAPSLTKILIKNELWGLMGRLLTGIKRYKEMSYIIDVLRDHQQFECLLSPPSEHNSKLKSSGLDRTLVHFLQSNYPQDKEMLRMVALHFLMFSDLAKLWHEEAEQILNKVIEASLYAKPSEESPTDRPSRGLFSMIFSDQDDRSPSSHSSDKDTTVTDSNSYTQIDYLKSPDVALLTEAMRCYCHASKYCIQEKQMMSALHHSRQAELIAVQINLLKSSPDGLALKVIRLPHPVLNCVLAEHLSIRESIIVARSYGVHPDWAGSLYSHFIRRGDSEFLEDFLRYSFMTSDIALDVVKKIERNGLRPEYRERIGTLLSHLKDVNTVYKIASQLDLRKKVEECLESKSACFLKDTVFRKGIAGSGRI